MGKLTLRVEPLPAGMTATNIYMLIATWFGIGRLRPAPGTIGTLAAMPFGYAIMYCGGPIALGISAVLLLIIGTFAASRYGQKSGTTDDQSIVVDEVVGLWVAAIPAGLHLSPWIAAFLLFRLFDIWKPWPVSYFDNRSRGGFDVMMDDVIAGIYAMLGVSLAALITFT